jgi:multidrug efflux system membrane fusion protein
VTQQSETEAVIADGLTTSDRVVTTGFASLSDGAKVNVGKDEPAPVADIAPRKRNRGGREGREARDGQPGKDWQSEHRGKRGERRQGDGDQQGQAGLVQGSEQPDSAAKSQP